MFFFFVLDLHPLALEDVLNGNPHTRSKADYYVRHLFLRVLCHELGSGEDPTPLEGLESQSFDSLGDEEDESGNVSEESKNGVRKLSILPTHLREASTARRDQLRKLIMKDKAVGFNHL